MTGLGSDLWLVNALNGLLLSNLPANQIVQNHLLLGSLLRIPSQNLLKTLLWLGSTLSWSSNDSVLNGLSKLVCSLNHLSSGGWHPWDLSWLSLGLSLALLLRLSSLVLEVGVRKLDQLRLRLSGASADLGCLLRVRVVNRGGLRLLVLDEHALVEGGVVVQGLGHHDAVKR